MDVMNIKAYLPCMLLSIGLILTAGAQTYTESGDAGDRPETAQATGTTACQNLITQIDGTHLADDVDMYAICIPDPVAFSATTTGGATWDTQLWLFDANGRGVTFNDDNPAGGLQSRITGAFIPGPGTYYLAISRYNRDALNCDDVLIWNNTPFGVERPPDGPGAAGRVNSWTGVTAAGGSYSIFLTGTLDAPLTNTQSCPPFEGWDETDNGGGDAGDLPETAQATGTSECAGALPRIRGQIGATDDVDLYVIHVQNPAFFSASTVGGTALNTQLWLFDTNGNGITHNDDNPAGGTQSTITGLNLPGPGTYYLAVSLSNRDAADCNDALLWANTPLNTERAPDGPGSGRLGAWVNGTTGTGRYIIELQGACTASRPAAPERCVFDGWREMEDGGGDAGELPENAQKVYSPDRDPCQSPITRIRGNNAASDTDMYVICITNPADFVATTVDGASWDTQLWLFNCDGTGVVFNDDSSGLQSRIDNSTGCIPGPGNYLLAISRYNRDAVDASGNLIWNNSPFAGVRCPDGPGAANPIAGWTGATTAGGVYTIQLQGAYFVSEEGCVDVPECEGDDNGDGCVDDADLLNVLFNFGSFGIGIPGDVNEDLVVDDIDLLVVLFNFGCGC